MELHKGLQHLDVEVVPGGEEEKTQELLHFKGKPRGQRRAEDTEEDKHVSCFKSLNRNSFLFLHIPVMVVASLVPNAKDIWIGFKQLDRTEVCVCVCVSPNPRSFV